MSRRRDLTRHLRDSRRSWTCLHPGLHGLCRRTWRALRATLRLLHPRDRTFAGSALRTRLTTHGLPGHGRSLWAALRPTLHRLCRSTRRTLSATLRLLHPRDRAFAGRALLYTRLTAHRLTRKRCGLRTALCTRHTLHARCCLSWHRLLSRTTLRARHTLHSRRRCGTWATLRTRLLRLHPRDRALSGPTLCTGLTAHGLTRKRCGLWPALRSRHPLHSRRRLSRHRLLSWSTLRARHALHARRRRGTWPTLSTRLLRLHPRDRTLSRATLCPGLTAQGLTRQSRGLGDLARARRASWANRASVCGVAIHHRHSAIWHRCRHGLRRTCARRTKCGRLHAWTLRLRGLARAICIGRCIGGGRGDFIAHPHAAATGRGCGFRLLSVVFPHDRREIEGFHLSRLIPGVSTARAFQSAAFLSQQFCRDFEMGRATGTGDTHSTTHRHPGLPGLTFSRRWPRTFL